MRSFNPNDSLIHNTEKYRINNAKLNPRKLKHNEMNAKKIINTGKYNRRRNYLQDLYGTPERLNEIYKLRRSITDKG